MMNVKAFVHNKGNLEIVEMAQPEVGQDEVLVTLKTAGLNRRDLYIPNRRGEQADALVLGSDGAGIIEVIGENVTSVKVGNEVVINPALRWNENSVAPPASFDILGMPDNGTFAEKIVIHADQVEPKPKHLSWEEAAAVALAGMTGYRAMFTKGSLEAGETVLIPGAGSGVATFLIQFAKNIGARVIVTSRSEEKRQQALAIGADLAIDTNGDWEDALKDETIDLVIESVGRATFNKSVSVLKKGGRLVVFGATTEDTVELDLRSFFYNQQQIFGSTMACREELRSMLSHMEKYKMKPIIDRVFSLEEANEAFYHLENSENFGKIVFTIK